MSNNAINHNQESSDKLRIDILMKEYETLRTEILQRINQRFTWIGLIGAVAAYTFFKVEVCTISSVLILTVAIFILGAIWFYPGLLIHQCSSRISEIENQINSLIGDQLLVWETRRKNKFFHRLHC